GSRVHPPEDGGRGLSIGADEMPDPLDEVQQVGAFLSDQALAEQLPQAPDVSSQPRLVVRGHRPLWNGWTLLGFGDPAGHGWV
ncbi:MAG TPA: hypothetical protein VE270_10030, partial [Thermoleophilaceae bacterium]|nr:hypothetical protein [Thermoleophilaceae bacterium]